MSRRRSDDSAITPARAAALDALDAVRKGRAADEALADAFAARREMKPEDKGLAQELVYGVLRWRRRLDAALVPFCRSGLPKDAGVLDLLRMAAHQLAIGMPPHAVVSTAVEAAKTRGHEHAASFVNAVLRALSAKPLPEPERPKGASHRALAEWASFPDWMVGEIARTFGEAALPDLLESMNARPPLVLRATPKAGGREGLLAKLAGQGATPGLHARDAVRVDWKGPVTSLPGFAEGLFAVQDEAAQLVTELLDPAGETLDVCAAPGGKAIHAAQLGAKVTAVDAEPKRLALVKEAASRLDASIETIAAVVTAEPIAALGKRRFARVLVDAPCSATGIVRRKPDVKWARGAEDPKRLAAKQLAILTGASHHVAPGGRLVYAVCSLVRTEGEEVVTKFLESAKDFAHVRTEGTFATSEGFFRTRPDVHDADGFFAAVLERRA